MKNRKTLKNKWGGEDMVYEIDREEMCRKIDERKGHDTCGLHISL